MPSVEERLTAALELAVRDLQRADTRGSLDALAQSLSQLRADLAEVKAVQAEIRETMATKADLAEVMRILNGVGAILDQLIDRT